MASRIPLRNTILFAKVQAVEGTAATIATTNAILATATTPEDSRTVDTLQFTGSVNDRFALSTVTDIFGKVTLETVFPAVGTLNPTLPVVDAPMYPLLTACGFTTTVNGSGHIIYDNDPSSVLFTTINIRKESDDFAPATQKQGLLIDCKGTLDVTASIGTRVKMTYNYNADPTIYSMESAIIPDYGSQLQKLAPQFSENAIGANGITVEEITDLATYTLSGVPLSLCISEFSAPNISGFQLDRFRLSCGSGFSKTAIANEITLTILEDAVGVGIFNPETSVQKYFKLVISWGLGTGTNVNITFRVTQLSNSVKAEVGTFFGKTLTFNNLDKTTITLT
ncbi:MAG: hypothetical protein ACREVA_01195 [Burkholderiales bacterium]